MKYAVFLLSAADKADLQKRYFAFILRLFAFAVYIHK